MIPQLLGLALAASGGSVIFEAPSAVSELDVAFADKLNAPIQWSRDCRLGHDFFHDRFKVVPAGPQKFVFFRPTSDKAPGDSQARCYQGVRLERLDDHRFAVGEPLQEMAVCGDVAAGYYPSERRIVTKAIVGKGATFDVFDSESGKRMASFPGFARDDQAILLRGDRLLIDPDMKPEARIVPAAEPAKEALHGPTKVLSAVGAGRTAVTYPFIQLQTPTGLAVFDARDGKVMSYPSVSGQPARLWDRQHGVLPDAAATPSGPAVTRLLPDGIAVFLLEGGTPRRLASGLPPSSQIFFDGADQQLVIRSHPQNPWVDALSLVTSPIEDPGMRDYYKQKKREVDEKTVPASLPTTVREITVAWPDGRVAEHCFELDVTGAGKMPAEAEKRPLADIGLGKPCAGNGQQALAARQGWKQIAPAQARTPQGAAAYLFNALVRQRSDELLAVLEPFALMRPIEASTLLERMVDAKEDASKIPQAFLKDWAKADQEFMQHDKISEKLIAGWELNLRLYLEDRLVTATLDARYFALRAAANAEKPPQADIGPRGPGSFVATWTLGPSTLRARFVRSEGQPGLPWRAGAISIDGVNALGR